MPADWRTIEKELARLFGDYVLLKRITHGKDGPREGLRRADIWRDSGNWVCDIHLKLDTEGTPTDLYRINLTLLAERIAEIVQK